MSESVFPNTVNRLPVPQALAETLLAVVHSHPDGHPVPSEGDMWGQMGAAVPGYGVSVLSEGGPMLGEMKDELPACVTRTELYLHPFLAESESVTGQILFVDGGQHLAEDTQP